MRFAAVLLLALAACIRPADERARLDLEVGRASAGDVEFEVAGGRAQVRRAAEGELELWAQAPVFRLRATSGASSASSWTIRVENCMPGAEAASDPASLSVMELPRPRPTVCLFEIDLPPATEALLDIAPPDAGEEGRFAFAAMGDIQTALPRVDAVFERMNQDPELRFVVSMGDLVENGEREEYELLQEKLALLDIPYFSTIGNHELDGAPILWHETFGLYNIHFDFRGVAFSFLDSGNASLDPIVYDRLEDWLERARDRIHVFGTHYPPLDPIGLRSASFRSRNEAAKLLTRLASGEVDLTLYGHIHSYYAYKNAGIPAYISGGGGAIPEKFDGVGRHYLKVEVDPARGSVEQVALIRVE